MELKDFVATEPLTSTMDAVTRPLSREINRDFFIHAPLVVKFMLILYCLPSSESTAINPPVENAIRVLPDLLNGGFAAIGAVSVRTPFSIFAFMILYPFNPFRIPEGLPLHPLRDAAGKPSGATPHIQREAF